VGQDIGLTQEIKCNGFHELPFVSCHKTVASVLLHNCAPNNNQFSRMAASQPTGSRATLDYCPGLPDSLPWPLPASITMVETPRNRFADHPAANEPGSGAARRAASL